MNILVGKIITAIYLSKDKCDIRFDIAEQDAPIIANSYGECCSSTWIENVENPEFAVDSVVATAEEMELNKPAEENSEFDYLQFYGFKIETAKGTCVIDYRNSSNGYYGGSLIFPRDDDRPDTRKYEWDKIA